MTIRGALVLVASITALSLSVTACTGSGDDDDDGFNQPVLVSIAITGATTVANGATVALTATGTYDNASTANITTTAVWVSSSAGVATVGGNTGVVTGVSIGSTTISATVGSVSDSHGVSVTAPVAPGPAIVQLSSFPAATGTELWLCFDHQFNGTIDTIFTTDAAGCEATVEPGIASTLDTAGRVLFLIDGLAGCDAAPPQNWEFDYRNTDDQRCPEGCVEEYDNPFASDDPFGTYCGPGAALPLSAFSAIFENTTQLPRFTVTAGNTAETTIEEFRVYSNNGVALISECTASVSFAPGGSGSFDPTCVPDLALVDATTYSTIIVGKVGGSPFGGRLDFVYESTP